MASKPALLPKLSNSIGLKRTSTIGLTLPLQKGSNGYFTQSYDSITQIKSNLLNFFKTRPSERRFNPEFGTRLYNYLFEQNIDGFDMILQNVIREDIQTWFPNVFVNNIFLDVPNTQKVEDVNNYIVRISIDFTFNNQTSSFSFNTTNNI